jgi:hypothetical protein
VLLRHHQPRCMPPPKTKPERFLVWGA